MQASRKYTLWQTIQWSKKYILIFLVIDTIPVALYYFLDWQWLVIPWQPISLIGIALAFYLGFKNNASYERLWEARKIWGGIVNTSRSFTVMARDFVSNDATDEPLDDVTLKAISKRLIYRHIAWLKALTYQMRSLKQWEHQSTSDKAFRDFASTKFSSELFEQLQPYLSEEDYDYVMRKGNKASHLLSRQSHDMIQLRRAGIVEHFRHLEIQGLLTELYTLQGKSERIKNFPFPRQYASANSFFASIFILLLPFGMLHVFSDMINPAFIWLAIPFSVVGSWVFWTMEMIGDYSENPFEGLYNDVPISAIARGIEIDIRQMIEDENIPAALVPQGDLQILV